MTMQAIKTPTTMTELSQSIYSMVSTKSRFDTFQRMYYNDRIAFAYDCLGKLGKSLTFYQEDIIGLFDDGYRRVAVRGPHGLGKTFIAALLTHHTVLTAMEDTKCITTASAWRQLEKYLWTEIRKFAKALDWQAIGRNPYDVRQEFFQLSIRLREGTVEAFAVASDDYTTIEGAHARRLMYILDEAKSIPRGTWDAIEGAFSNADSIGKLNGGNLSNKKVIGGMEDIRVDMLDGLVMNGEGKLEYNGKETVVFDREEDVIGGEEIGSSEVVGSSGYSSGVTGMEKGYGSEHGVVDCSVEGCHLNPPPHVPHQPNNVMAQSSMPNNPTTSQSFVDHNMPNCDEAIAFAISTPGSPSGQFYDIHMKKPGYEDWVAKHVSVEDAIAAGRINSGWVEQRKRQWGEYSSTYQNRVLGEFADDQEVGIIPLSWVRIAHQRWIDWVGHGRSFEGMPIGKRTVGIDVARSGSDKTVAAVRTYWVVETIKVHSKLSMPHLARSLEPLCPGRSVHIEMDGGIGASLYDIMRDRNVPSLHPITVAAATKWRDRSRELHFLNVRAAMWWNLRELLNPDNGEPIALPPIEEMTQDLITPKWDENEKGVVRLEAKESIMDRLGRSPDYGTAVCLAFWGGTSGGGVVF